MGERGALQPMKEKGGEVAPCGLRIVTCGFVFNHFHCFHLRMLRTHCRALPINAKHVGARLVLCFIMISLSTFGFAVAFYIF